MKQFKKTLNQIATELPGIALTIIQVEGSNFIKKNFRDQGFNDVGLKKWASRKTTNKKGRDLTRYRTNRVGRVGGLSRFGSSNNDRAILVGHETGGDKLKNSFATTTQGNSVIFKSYKPYATAHNEGTKNITQRQFIGKSKYLGNNIKTKLHKEFQKLIK